SPVEASKDPDRSTIFHLYSLVATKEEIVGLREAFQRGGHGYSALKKQLFAKLWDYFAPMRTRRSEIIADPRYVEDVLEHGARKANEVANKVMARVREAVGL